MHQDRRLIVFMAAMSLIAITGTARAATECPGPKTKKVSGSVYENQSSLPYQLELLPCQTVVVELTGSAAVHPSGNASMTLAIRNADSVELATNNFVCGPSCSTSVPIAGTVPGYPLPGTRGPGGLAVDVIVKAGLFNFFGRQPATYQLTIRIEPRTGYNTAGNSFANAPLVSLPATQLGSIHPLDPGQYVKVHLDSNKGFYVSGHVQGHPSWGPYYEIDVYDAAFHMINPPLHYGTAYGGPFTYNSRTPFVNTGPQAADFYVRIWCRYWPLWDFSMNLVPYTVTTEVTEVGFRLDHPISRWPDRQAIDKPDGTMPTWIKGRGGDQKMDYPAAYTMNTRPNLFAVISINPALPSNTSVSVRVKRDGAVVGTRPGLTFVGSTGRVDSLQLDVDLETAPGVKASDYTFDWEWSRDGGANWIPLGQSGEHRIYWTYAAPYTYPFTNQLREATSLYQPTYTLALEKATDAARGSTDPTAIKHQLNQELHKLTYDPSSSVGGHPLTVYDRKRGQCDDMAHLMRGLLRSIGILSETFYVWGGGPGPNGEETYWYAFGGQPVSFRVDRPSEDGVPAFPHFTFHAVTGESTTGLIYDPSYGQEVTGPLVGLDETLDAPNGNFIHVKADVRQIWSMMLNLTPRPPVLTLKPCDHDRRLGPFAGFVDQSIATAMTSGQTYSVTVTFRNTGDDAWLTDQGFTVDTDPDVAGAWGSTEATLPATVTPDGEVTFTMQVTAPGTAGEYPLSFRIRQAGVAFGAVTTPVTVNVQ